MRDNLLELDDELSVIPSPYALTVKPFKALYERYSAEETRRLFAYIYFMRDPRSKFMPYTEDRRKGEILKVIGEIEESEYLNRALDEYSRHESSVVMLLGAARESVAKLTTWLENIDIEDEGYDAYRHVQILEKMGKTVEGLKTLEDAAKKESQLNETYGGVTVDKYSE